MAMLLKRYVFIISICLRKEEKKDEAFSFDESDEKLS